MNDIITIIGSVIAVIAAFVATFFFGRRYEDKQKEILNMQYKIKNYVEVQKVVDNEHKITVDIDNSGLDSVGKLKQSIDAYADSQKK